jgi:hypothetical protein
MSDSSLPLLVPDAFYYHEYKLLLRADQFGFPQQFRQFWKITRRTAKRLGVEFRPRGKPAELRVREVLFFDTPAFDLYNNSFILRRRTFYKKGVPAASHELTLKCRHQDRDVTIAADMRPRRPRSNYVIKFKEEALTASDRNAKIRWIYSHACEVTTSDITLTRGYRTIAEMFPALRRTDAQHTGKLSIVNNVAIEEWLVNLGKLDFGDGLTAKATIAVWRNRETQEQLVGEYSYQVRFDALELFRSRRRKLPEAFFLAMQKAASDWVYPGTTKTSMVYHLGKVPIRNRE